MFAHLKVLTKMKINQWQNCSK